MRITYEAQLEQKQLRQNIESNLDIITEIVCKYKDDDKKLVNILMQEIFWKTRPDLFPDNNDYLVENIIQNALSYSFMMHKDQKRDSGAPYFVHPVQNSYVVAEFGSTPETIVVSILHDVFEENEDIFPKVAHDVFKRFGSYIFSNIYTLTTFDRSKDRDKILTENIRFANDVAIDNNLFRNRIGDGISNLHDIEYMKGKNGMTPYQRKRKYCLRAREMLLPMSRELDERGDIPINVTGYILEQIHRVI